MGQRIATHGVDAAPAPIPSSNLVLRALAKADRLLLEKGAEPLHLRRGDALIEVGQPLDALFFPETTLLTIAKGLGDRAEIAVVGREGFAGWSLLLGAKCAGHSVAVSTRDGCILRVGFDIVRKALGASPTLRIALLAFVEVLTVQMGTSIRSTACDHLDVRIARWLLMRHDRVGGDELLVCHAEMAAGLGIRRASVTDILHIFEGDGLVRCRRGQILIRDRDRLEKLAAGSYGEPERCYKALIGPCEKFQAILEGSQRASA